MVKLSSREFNQDLARAKRAAVEGPVIVTDRGAPAFVLMTYDEYCRLAGPACSILDLLDQNAPAAEAAEPFDTPPLGDTTLKRAKFS